MRQVVLQLLQCESLHQKPCNALQLSVLSKFLASNQDTDRLTWQHDNYNKHISSPNPQKIPKRSKDTCFRSAMFSPKNVFQSVSVQPWIPCSKAAAKSFSNCSAICTWQSGRALQSFQRKQLTIAAGSAAAQSNYFLPTPLVLTSRL